MAERGGDGVLGRVEIFALYKAVSPLRSATAVQSSRGQFRRLCNGAGFGLLRDSFAPG